MLNRGVFFLSVFGINYCLNTILLINLATIELLIINSFLCSVFLLSSKMENKIKGNLKNTARALYINFFRLLLCLIFILPHLFELKRASKNYIFSFITIYFLYSFYEIFLRIKKNQ